MSTIAQATYAEFKGTPVKQGTFEKSGCLCLCDRESHLQCQQCPSAKETKQHFLTQAIQSYLSIYCVRLKNN